ALIKRALFTRPAKIRSAQCQEIVETPNLSQFPILKCWPGDAGRFITYGMVISHDPISKARNLGLYRLQVFGNDTTGMHWQSMKGHFGDHFGHYSEAAEFPVMHIRQVTRRRNAIYAGTVVGKPPQEDKYLGEAAGEMIGPLIQLINPNITNLHAFAGAGFHNLLVVSLK